MSRRKKNRAEQSVVRDVADVVSKTADAFLKELGDVLIANTRYAIDLSSELISYQLKELIDAMDNKEELRKRLEEMRKAQKEVLKMFLKLK